MQGIAPYYRWLFKDFTLITYINFGLTNLRENYFARDIWLRQRNLQSVIKQITLEYLVMIVTMRTYYVLLFHERTYFPKDTINKYYTCIIERELKVK